MKNRLLKTGDRIKLRKGMTVYADIPERFVFFNRPFSMACSKTEVKIGQVRRPACSTPRNQLAEEVADSVKKAFDEHGLSVSEDQLKAFVKSQLDVDLPKQFATDYLEGTFVVITVKTEGGGTGMGDHDVYPNGHHVFCVKVGSPAVRCDFYQTGSFTAMITPDEIQPL